MLDDTDLHVILEGNGWKVVRQNDPIPIRTADTREDAIHHASRLQREHQDGGRILIHGPDGTVLAHNRGGR